VEAAAARKCALTPCSSCQARPLLLLRFLLPLSRPHPLLHLQPSCRPHPWGLLITFIELIKNPRYSFWSVVAGRDGCASALRLRLSLTCCMCIRCCIGVYWLLTTHSRCCVPPTGRTPLRAWPQRLSACLRASRAGRVLPASRPLMRTLWCLSAGCACPGWVAAHYPIPTSTPFLLPPLHPAAAWAPRWRLLRVAARMRCRRRLWRSAPSAGAAPGLLDRGRTDREGLACG